MNRKLVSALGFTAAAFTLCNATHAQDFARLPMRIVAATPAGGAADVNARRIADRLSRALKQSVIVQNVAGGAGNIAAATIADATPNGNSMLFVAHPVLAVNPLLYTKLPFNAERDFQPVVLLSKTPHVLLAHTGLAATNVNELLALAKARPGALNFASGGTGTSIHLAGELLRDATGIDITHVPYKGVAAFTAAVLSNEIQVGLSNLFSTESFWKPGRLRLIAHTGTRRLDTLPDVPTVAESGVPGYEATIWYGFMAPAKTAPAIVQQLYREIRAIAETPDVRQTLVAQGNDVVANTPQEFAKFISAEATRWGDAGRRLGVAIE